MKTYTKKDFNTSAIKEMLPGQTVVIECADAREVQNVRTLAAQYKRLNNPEGIVRYGSVAKFREDGTCPMELTAMTE